MAHLIIGNYVVKPHYLSISNYCVLKVASNVEQTEKFYELLSIIIILNNPLSIDLPLFLRS
jgi:hypothetical protein